MSKAAIVTGASSGIGLAISRVLCEKAVSYTHLGMAWREEKKLKTWTVPYLPIDPMDVGRTYDADVIRINSQSGKGGISYILKQNFSISLPQAMKEEVGYAVKQVSDEEHKELSPQWVYELSLLHICPGTTDLCKRKRSTACGAGKSCSGR